MAPYAASGTAATHGARIAFDSDLFIRCPDLSSCLLRHPGGTFQLPHDHILGADCPVFDGLYEYCQTYTGGATSGAARINQATSTGYALGDAS